MKVDQALVDACYRQLLSKDFHVGDEGISFRMTSRRSSVNPWSRRKRWDGGL